MKPPKGWEEPWALREGGDYDPARVFVDNDDFRKTRGAVGHVVCEVDQGEHSEALAAYIVALHNATVGGKKRSFSSKGGNDQ